MIKFNDQIPSVYPSASRDFQYFAWLIDIVLNSVKHNIDDLYDLPNNKADHKLTELLAMTLGFKVKRNYDQNQLRAIVVALPRILKYKGTKTAIDMAGNALLAASGAAGSFKSEVNASGELEVTFPVTLVDIALFTDLLEYILPAGMTCHIIRENQVSRQHTTEVIFDDILYADCLCDLELHSDKTSIDGLASMFKPNENEPFFSNFKLEADGSTKPTDIFAREMHNTGLLDNSIIPMLGAGFIIKEEADIDPGFSTEQNDFGTTVIIEDYSTTETDTGTTIRIEETDT
jgi:hypothetical protein